MGLAHTRPSSEILSGATGDVYFARAQSILEREGIDPIVTMEVFCREDAVLCGMDEAKNLIGHVLAACDPSETRVDALEDGDRIAPKEVVLRIRARYSGSPCTRRRSWGCSRSRRAGPRPRASASTLRPRSR